MRNRLVIASRPGGGPEARRSDRLERLPHAVAPGGSGAPAEQFAGAAGVERDPLHLARPRRGELGREAGLAAELAEDLDQVEDADLDAGADVDRPDSLGGRRGERRVDD